MFEEADAPTDPLAPLLGRTRAGLLLALATPSSTTQLAALTGASIGATGDHLKVLLDAGLLTRARVARSVVYRRTPLGDALDRRLLTGTAHRVVHARRTGREAPARSSSVLEGAASTTYRRPVLL